MKSPLSLVETANRVGIEIYQLQHAIRKGQIVPTWIVAGRRLFDTEAIEKVRRHFNV